MGDPKTEIQSVSLAPLWGSGFITDGKLLKFGSPYPLGSTSVKGLELAIDFREVDAEARTEKRSGQLALMYYYGKSHDHFDQSDLPLGDNPLAGLLQFSATRDADSHFLMMEWRWPLFSPVYESKHLRLLQPQYSLGLGGVRIHTQVTQDGAPKSATDYAGFATGASQLRLAEVTAGRMSVSLEVSLRMLVGQDYGVFSESSLRFAYRL